MAEITAMDVPAAQFATSSLTVDFMSSACAGAWLQSETDRIRVGKRICVVTAAIVCDGASWR